MKANASVPGIGQTWRVDFGSDGPWGRFFDDVTFESQTELSLVAARGDADGDRFDASYTKRGEFVQLVGSFVRRS
ncbi:MAG: hypothetical protein WDO69_16485 [Pseudomonadota bacterium]